MPPSFQALTVAPVCLAAHCGGPRVVIVSVSSGMPGTLTVAAGAPSEVSAPVESMAWQLPEYCAAAMPEKEFEAKVERTKKKQRSALDGTAKVERAEMRAIDEAPLERTFPTFRMRKRNRSAGRVVPIDDVKAAVPTWRKLVEW